MKLCILGLGYIGLPTAAMFAANGIEVHGVDVNSQVVERINQGKIHIVEPGLADVVQKCVDNKLLCASDKPCFADCFIICVPTPFKNDNHEPDISFVETAAESIAPFLRKGNTIILESTSPVGTTDRVAEIIKIKRPDLKIASESSNDCEIYLAYCPERVLPGKIMEELIKNDRVIGGINEISAQKATAIYKNFVKGDILQTDAKTAEMSKLTENAFRDVNIAFANELSLICDKLNINVWKLIELANHHPRVNILNPGPGVGGHCIAVDPWFIVSKTPELAKLIHMARNINDGKSEWVEKQVKEAVEKLNNKEPKIACLGLAFKPDIDDLRESPSLKITFDLSREFPSAVVAVEPNICNLPESLKLCGVKLVSLEEALVADVVVLLVDHQEFKTIKPVFSDTQVLIDTRGIWN